MPELNGSKTVTLIDQDGLGVVSCIYVSKFDQKHHIFQNPDSAQSLLLRVWTNHEAHPGIEMPLMDFLADVQGSSAFFSTQYFFKVKHSHNFRLPLPFRCLLRMTV